MLYNHHHGMHGPDDPPDACIYRASTDELIQALLEALQDTGTVVDTESRAGFWLADHLKQFPPKSYLVIEVENNE